MPKSSSLGVPSFAGSSDQDVAGLEVAVHDEVLVRVLHCVAHGEQQSDARADVEAMTIAIGIDRLAFDELHHEIRLPALRRAAVDEARDVGVLERGESLTLAAEAPQDLVGVHAALDDLERDALHEFTVGARREVDDAHAAARETALESIAPDRAADHVVLRRIRDRARVRGQQHEVGAESGLLQESADAIGMPEERNELDEERRLVAAQSRRGRRALVLRQRGDLEQDLLDARPVFAVDARAADHERDLMATSRCRARDGARCARSASRALRCSRRSRAIAPFRAE
jgi:hypothetical protein